MHENTIHVHVCMSVCLSRYADLSFNNIEVVSGLEELVNLRDLSLAHNRIQRIENIDTLTQLQVLSVGNNLIEDLDNVSVLAISRL